jgi:hypothetical protein
MGVTTDPETVVPGGRRRKKSQNAALRIGV